jgi:hypothetical protein
MLSDPKNQQKKLETVHQFVTTSHLMTAYTASLAQYSNSENRFPEIDTESWTRKITAELQRTLALLNQEEQDESIIQDSRLKPEDLVSELLEQRKSEINENEFFDIRDPNRITRLTELNNISEILELIYDVVHEQRKVIEHYRKIT